MANRTFLISRGLAFVITLLVLGAMLLPPQAAQAEDDHVFIFGTMTVNTQTTNCNSPVGICLTGTVSGNVLNGKISGQANTITEVDKNGLPIAYTLTGVSTITTKRGTLNESSFFYQNYPALTGHGTLNITDGTGRYSHTRGVIFINEPNPPVPPVPEGVQTFYYSGWLSRDAVDRNDK